MTVYDREAKFRQIVERVLGEVDHDGLSVGYYLETKSVPSLHRDEEGIGLHDATVWRLSLWVTPEGHPEGLYVSAAIPFGDGNDENIEELTRELWRQYQFGSVMQHENMDEALGRVVTEVEGP